MDRCKLFHKFLQNEKNIADSCKELNQLKIKLNLANLEVQAESWIESLKCNAKGNNTKVKS